MNKRQLFIWGLLASYLHTAPVTLEEAQNVAVNWMFEKSGKELTADQSALGAAANSDAAYRIVKLKPEGWVIVSGDDIAKPVIGYGFSAIGKTYSPAFVDWMKGVEDQIESAKNTLSATSTKVSEASEVILKTWRKYKVAVDEFKNSNALGATGANDFGYQVRPLFWMGSSENTEEQGILWDQGTYYNSSCPVDADGPGGHVWAGCVATTMGQIMRYYEYPAQGFGSHSYMHPTYGEQSANFGATSYDWVSMPLTLTAENSRVAQVLYQTGVAVDMDYGVTGSAAFMGQNDAMKQFFGYEIASRIMREGYTEAQWRDILQNELDNSRPVAYAGFGNGGHQFIIDGYDSENFYHMNWGWGGNLNGKFILDDLTPGANEFSYNQEAMIILPQDASPMITISDGNLESCVMDALGVDGVSKITQMKAKLLTYLDCSNQNIADITTLQHFTGLETLWLSNNNITDISALQNLTKVSQMSLGSNNIVDISALQSMTQLYNLYLYDNNIQDITALQDMTNMQYLNIQNNQISDITALQNMTLLEGLYLGGNAISDFSPIVHLAADVVEGKDQQRYLDLFEPNDNPVQAVLLHNGLTSHSIGFSGDEDWFKIIVTTDIALALETDGELGDTQMYVYDNSGTNQVGYDDDGGNGTFSKITQMFIHGTYYIKIIAYGNSGTIDKYTLSISGLPKSTNNDFNTDNISDILWRNSTTGMNYLYLMNGSTITSEGVINTVDDPNWQIAGIADFNGDGSSDILWRNKLTGENYLYLMDGIRIASQGVLNTVSDLNWEIQGTGDYDGDGKADILWRNSATGMNYLYTMDGSSITSQGVINTVADQNWKIESTKDYNGDGKADILWRNQSTGMNYLYTMNGSTISSQGIINTVADQSWKIAGTADFNGDGKADILWRNQNTGMNYLYTMDGSTITSQGVINTVADQNWKIKGTGDYNGDGKADILWRNTNTGMNYLYFMDGSTIASQGVINTVSDVSWEIVNK